MGLFKNRTKVKPGDVAAALGVDVLEVVGESQYPQAFISILKQSGLQAVDGTERIVKGAMRREKKNKADPNAVAVYAAFQKVGYLSREDALAVIPLLDAAGGQLFVDVRTWGRYDAAGSVFASARVLLS